MRIYTLLFLIFLISCEPGGPAKNVNENSQTEGPDSIFSYKKIELDKYYSLEIPEPCEESSLLNDEAATQYLSIKYQFGVIVLNEEINSARKAMTILKPVLEESKVDTQFIDHYIQFQINNLKTVAESYDYPMVKAIEIDGYNARTFEITTDIKNDPIRRCFVGVVIEGNSQVYYLYLFYPADKQEEYRDITEHVIESFDLNERAFDVTSNSDSLSTKSSEITNTKAQSGNTRKK